MKKLAFFILTFSLSALSNEVQNQKFNDYSGDLKLSSVNFTYYVAAFSGSQIAEGEVVFEVRPFEGNEDGIYNVAFIPEQPSLFPYVKDGFYAKKLIKIDLLNHAKAKELLFSEEEWKAEVAKGNPYISKKVSIEIVNYATSVECDSRHYYAEILNVKFKNVLANNFSERTELWGC